MSKPTTEQLASVFDMLDEWKHGARHRSFRIEMCYGLWLVGLYHDGGFRAEAQSRDLEKAATKALASFRRSA